MTPPKFGPPYCVVPIRCPAASETGAAAGLDPALQSPCPQNLCKVANAPPERRHTTPSLLALPPNCAVPIRAPFAAMYGASTGAAPSAHFACAQKEYSTV